MLDIRRRTGERRAQGVPQGEGLGTGGLESGSEWDFKRPAEACPQETLPGIQQKARLRVLYSHRSLILETNSEIWKFSFQRVNELKTNRSLGRLGAWWQMGYQLSHKSMGNLISTKIQ